MSSTSSRSNSARAGRRELRKQTTRSELLGAGRRLFGEFGLYEPTVEDLASHAGIAKGTLYGYFADKEALLEAVLQEATNALAAHVCARASHSTSADERIRALTMAHFEFFDAHPDLMRIMHQARGFLKFDRPGSVALRQVLTGYLDRLSRELMASGEPYSTRAAARRAAFTMFGAVSGISSVQVTLGGTLPRGIERERLTEGIALLIMAAHRATPKHRRHRGSPRLR